MDIKNTLLFELMNGDNLEKYLACLAGEDERNILEMKISLSPF